VVAVIAPVSSRISRIKTRDNISSARANQRAAAQNADIFYTSVADITIINDTDEAAFESAAVKLIKRIHSL
jgi:dephospho-CoA kinase